MPAIVLYCRNCGDFQFVSLNVLRGVLPPGTLPRELD